MDMTVEADQGLPILDEALNGNTAHMDIHRDMLHKTVIQCGPVQPGLIGRRMKKENSSLQGISGAKILEIVLD